MDYGLHPVTKAVATLTALAATLWTLWCNVIAFTGGVLPIPFVDWYVSGGLIFGLFWLFIIDPLMITLGWWASIVLLSPLLVAEGVRSARKGTKNTSTGPLPKKEAILRARARYIPLLLVEQDEGGPGDFWVSDDGPVFVTDGGFTHRDGWEWYEAYKIDGPQVTLWTNPGDGARITFATSEPDEWSEVFQSHGLDFTAVDREQRGWCGGADRY